jgi:uncharacterized membrane protein YcfT
MAWIDIIKATSVILVVLWHVVQTLDVFIDGTIVADAWYQFMLFLEPLRMPVFFVVSGMLASSAVKRPWSWTKSRTIGVLYLYLVWHTLLAVFTVVFNVVIYGHTPGMFADAFYRYFIGTFIAGDGYWYFYALVLYFVLAKLLRNVNPWLVIGAAAAINLARPEVTHFIFTALAPLEVSHLLPSVAFNAVYFFAGVYFVQFFKSYAERNDTRLLIVTGSIAVAGSLARLVDPGLAAKSFLPIAIAWVLTAILIAVRVQDNPAVARFGAYVGPRTLPIYAIQFLILHPLHHYLAITGGPLLENSAMLQLIYPVVVTLAMVAFSLWIYDKAMAHGWSSLFFKAPSSWTARPRRESPASASILPAAPHPEDIPATVGVGAR